MMIKSIQTFMVMKCPKFKISNGYQFCFQRWLKVLHTSIFGKMELQNNRKTNNHAHYQRRGSFF